MVNKNLFSTSVQSRVPAANTVNEAGGKAYSLTDEAALAQYAVTGTFGNTYYATAETQLATVKNLAAKCSSEFIAKLAVYSRESAHMKDMGAYLLAVLAARGELELLGRVFSRVCDNAKMLLNFCQIVRSGVTGRKSFGSAVRRLIRNWLTEKKGYQLFNASVGHANPSLADVIKMVHPKAVDERQNAMFAYLLDKPYDLSLLDQSVREFEAFKLDNSAKLPNVPWRALTNCKLTTDHWKKIARDMPFSTLRMNLNMLGRNGVYDDKALVKELAAKLSNPEEIRKNLAFPYQLLTTYQNTSDIPMELSLALQQAMETATENVPNYGEVAVCIDLSGSMQSPVTGQNGKIPPSKTTCVDVAALIAASIARKNPANTTVIAWATSAKKIKFNPLDSVMTLSQNFKKVDCGGGTNAQTGLQELNKLNWSGDLVFYVSDNQSWMNGSDYYSQGTGMAGEWAKLSSRSKKTKLVCLDIQPYANTQVQDGNKVLNLGSFTDSCWLVIDAFLKHDSKDFVSVINQVEL